MDGYHHHPYARPPQPPADPNFYHHHQQGRPPALAPPQLPPQNAWYPNQLQYQPPSSHSPSPPPQSWGPPLPPYPPPQTYPNPNHFPPPPPPRPHAYPNQEWTNPNWGQHQGWDYSAGPHSNAEDWAAKARAWAASKTVEDQYPQSQYPQPIKPEGQGQFRGQHFQPGDSHYQGAQQPPFPAPGYQEYPVTGAALHQPPPYPGEHLSHQFGVGNTAGASSGSSSSHQQEVPSSYSSVTGNYNHKEQPYNSMHLPSSMIHEEQNRQLSPPFGKSVLTDHPFAYGGQGPGLGTDPSDQPLNFVHTHHDPAGDIRGSVSGTSLSSVSSWTPNVATGTLYPPFPPGHSSVAQHDPSVPFPSTVTGTAAPPFASYSSISSFQPTVPSVASYTVPSGNDFNTITSFPGDSYGVPNVSDRPKKASVPNWLKEEIIRNASVITRSAADHPTEENKSTEDEGVDKSLIIGDQVDSKSIDSTRSTEDEDEDDDDEDDAEAARTAIINQEIKRVLTEVLLKVTDELFDEIATKVLNEDDPRGNVKHHISSKDHKNSPSSPAVPTPKAEAKILVPAKVEKTEHQDVSEKSSSGMHGNLLGLFANYATDEDDDDEDGETRILSHQENAAPQLSNSKVSEEAHVAVENGSSSVELRKSYHGHPKSSPGVDEHDPSKVVLGIVRAGTSVDDERTFDRSQVDVARGANASKRSDLLDPKDNSVEVFMKDNSRTGAMKAKSNQTELLDSKADYAGKGYVNQTGSTMTGVVKDSDYRRGEDINGSKDRVRDQVEKASEKIKEFDSRRRTSQASKEDHKEEKYLKASAKGDSNRNAPTKHKEDDRARRKHVSESSRHKRRRSPSDSSRHRNSKDHDSSDEASDDSKRGTSLRKKQSSLSSVRSRGRHHSRSPNSKHSQRRHSPYSSLETARRHKTRSRSPSRWHR